MEQTLNEKIVEILYKIETVEFWGTFKNADEISNAIEKLFYEEQIKLLNDVFGDGLGNIDTNCSKDDLLEIYQEKIKELTNKTI